MTEVRYNDVFRGLIDYGIRNLSLYRDHVNELNVFPVPDGDTGTNMLLTIENGYAAIEDMEGDLSDLAKKLGSTVVLGARGNSGVILSQFLNGFSETAAKRGSLAPEDFVAALRSGVEYSYKGVADPVEGTMLTVMREATECVEKLIANEEITSLEALISRFLDAARVSLEHTPDLLPVLKEAGVIDSGGAGFVYLFEGMKKFLSHEQIERVDGTVKEKYVDYSKFDRTSSFPLGYCNELLIQLMDGRRPFDEAEFVKDLGELGESIVISRQDDHIKVHVHSMEPEKVLNCCHEYGEFLSLKIENMTVQHTETHKIVEVSPGEKHTSIGVVAVANDRFMRDKFFEMGADVVINAVAGYTPSAKDFMDAYEASDADHVLVFPNYKNSFYVAEQAKELMGNTNVTVFETKSVAECYAALAILDFGCDDPDEAAYTVRAAISRVRIVNISRAVKDKYFGETAIRKNDHIAVSGGKLYAAGASFTQVVKNVINRVDSEMGCDVITFFFGEGPSRSDREEVLSFVEENLPMTDTDVMETETERFELILSFE